ncbi:efflux RND transporter periplasmic adaptor subunit [Psychrobium sp. MM17-31]|uniref:efflux RND transporter periplasmic adaptor subunit n=1 Tax=Psychrobium sp. MM17-31 TaxID=2917758 RepID=UPI001EF3DD72|nr:efflux RND transporter periplasmic adaptor subunit [Psychrobium sp. MM17-31]MCG7530767.1 efflux RND transporter periplasmic adaptor subunit [Psychrobium sp. MM17-31]
MQTTTKASIITALLITGLLSGCSESNAKDEEKKEKEFAIPVVTAQIKQQPISSTYHSTATLESRDDAQVISRVTGIVEQLNVEEGDYVEKGQLLAKIDSRRYKLALDKANAELASINQELNRLKKLESKKLVSHDQVDKLKFSFQSAKAARDLAALDLEDSLIKAPISGFIANKMVKEGHFSQSYQQLLHIVNQQDLQAVLYVPEAQLANVKLKQQATLSFSALPNQTFNAHVRSIAPVIDNKSGTFKVILALANNQSLLKPGMFAQISVIFDTHQDSLTVPSDAIIHRDGQQYVFVVSNNKASEVAVTTGYVEEEITEITGDIDSQTQIVIKGHRNLKNDTLVEVLNQPKADVEPSTEEAQPQAVAKAS